mmetsp:Transcript_66719/g.177905  ORF Transcript_66719/g.177905 Transcript_66719/m.177905 type:complete len:118 (+) Transcript_66719:37-390(+)
MIEGGKPPVWIFRFIYASIAANLGYMGYMSVKRQWKQIAEEEARQKQIQAYLNQTDNKFRCFFAARQYYQECQFEFDPTDSCKRLVGTLDECKQEILTNLPEITPAMRGSLREQTDQ